MRQLIGLVVCPHFLQCLVDGSVLWYFSMELYSHQVGHSVKQTRDLQQLLAGMFNTVCPCMVNKKNALGDKNVPCEKEIRTHG